MSGPRVPIFDRLPAVHRIRDAEQKPPDQLRAFAGLLERAFGEIHGDIESLYHDLFIDTCAEWVIPYIADLLGTSHLSGDPWTLRADVADTIALRRRKGTVAAIERLVYDLTRWPAHAVELRDHLVWSQHLNHQRPDAGGDPPLSGAGATGLLTVPRGGTITLRHPATLSLLDSPFDPFAHVPDLRPPAGGAVRYNLPNLAVFLWRLEDYRVPAARPGSGEVIEVPDDAFPPELDPDDFAAFVVAFDIHPMAEPVVLFNWTEFDPHALPLRLGDLDAMPGPIPRARLDSIPAVSATVVPPDRGLGELAGAHERYVTTAIHDPDDPTTLDIGATALTLHVPDDDAFAAATWRFRGANLCARDRGLVRPLEPFEVAIDPVMGRLLFGVADRALGELLRDGLRVTYTYGAVGPIGAHPGSREPPAGEPAAVPSAEYATLEAALAEAAAGSGALVIEIVDSGTYDLDPALLTDGPEVVVGRPLVVRAADRQRPVIRLAAPLEFITADGVDPASVRVRFEGIYLTRDADFAADAALVEGVAVDGLELVDCTLDPGGVVDGHGVRAPIRTAIALAGEAEDFGQTPEIHLRRCISGPIRAERGYRLFVTESIVDAGTGPYEDPDTAGYAITGAVGEPAEGWGPALQLDGITVLGRVRVYRAGGQGGIFSQPLEVLDNQRGCIKHSWFAAGGNRLPQRHACLFGDDARLLFTSETFGRPAYGQLADGADWRIRDRGPGDDAMGATGFLRQAHGVRNMHIRFREFMPVGVRPLLVPVT